MGRPVEDPAATVATEAVLDDELATLDEDLDPEAAGDADPGTAEMVFASRPE